MNCNSFRTIVITSVTIVRTTHYSRNQNQPHVGLSHSFAAL